MGLVCCNVEKLCNRVKVNEFYVWTMLVDIKNLSPSSSSVCKIKRSLTKYPLKKLSYRVYALRERRRRGERGEREK